MSTKGQLYHHWVQSGQLLTTVPGRGKEFPSLSPCFRIHHGTCTSTPNFQNVWKQHNQQNDWITKTEIACKHKKNVFWPWDSCLPTHINNDCHLPWNQKERSNSFKEKDGTRGIGTHWSVRGSKALNRRGNRCLTRAKGSKGEGIRSYICIPSRTGSGLNERGRWMKRAHMQRSPLPIFLHPPPLPQERTGSPYLSLCHPILTPPSCPSRGKLPPTLVCLN